MLPKAILFDLDDTILTFDAVGEEAWWGACRDCAARRKGIDPGLLYEAIWDVRQWYWSDPERNRLGRLNLDEARREIVLAALKHMGVADEPLAALVAGEYDRRKLALIGFFPGAEQALAELLSRGVAMALLTNGEAGPQRGKIARFRLDRFFRTILIEGEIGVGKPEAEIFRRGLAELGADAAEAWCVGDNLEWDIAGPQRLGIFSIWNDHRKAGLPPGATVRPDRIIHSITELLR